MCRLKQAARHYMSVFGQALEAHGIPFSKDQLIADATLREALAEQAEQEPVGVVEGSGEWGIAGVLVAGVPLGTPLYAAPVRTKDLTEAEIDEIWKKHSGGNLGFAYAVIAADREKNK